MSELYCGNMATDDREPKENFKWTYTGNPKIGKRYAKSEDLIKQIEKDIVKMINVLK